LHLVRRCSQVGLERGDCRRQFVVLLGAAHGKFRLVGQHLEYVGIEGDLAALAAQGVEGESQRLAPLLFSYDR